MFNSEHVLQGATLSLHFNTLHLVSEPWFVCQWLLTLLLLWVLWVWATGVRGHRRHSHQLQQTMHLSPQVEEMVMDEANEPSLTEPADREVSLLLQNLYRAIDATSKGASFSVPSAVRPPLPSGVSVPGVTSPVSDPGVKFDKWLTRARLDKPTKFDGESNEGRDRVKAFLSELQRFFAVTDLPFVSWGAVTPHFLEKSALLMWELEFQGIIVTHGPTVVTWAMFEKFMHDQYGRLQPACETRAAYEKLRESDFDSVSSFIRAFHIKERELVGTPYHPGSCHSW